MDSIKNIKASIVLPKNNNDQEYDQIEMFYVPGVWGNAGGSTIKIRWSEIIADPVLAIKRDSRVARLTNARPEEIQFINNTPLSELQKILKSDGKNTRSRRRTSRKAVPSNEEE